MSDYHIVTCFMSTDAKGVSDHYFNRATAWFTNSKYIHVETYFAAHDDTWRLNQNDDGEFYAGKQYRADGWVTFRTDLGRDRYEALRDAFAEYSGSKLDDQAFWWYPIFRSGCCTRTNLGYTMCSHVVADVYSRWDVAILPDRDELMPFTKNTPASLFEAIRARPESRANYAPKAVTDRNVAATTSSNLLAAVKIK